MYFPSEILQAQRPELTTCRTDFVYHRTVYKQGSLSLVLTQERSSQPITAVMLRPAHRIVSSLPCSILAYITTPAPSPGLSPLTQPAIFSLPFRRLPNFFFPFPIILPITLNERRLLAMFFSNQTMFILTMWTKKNNRFFLVNFYGPCTLASFVPAITIHKNREHAYLLQLPFRRTSNLLVERSSRFPSFVRGYFLGLGDWELERAIVNILAEMEQVLT